MDVVLVLQTSTQTHRTVAIGSSSSSSSSVRSPDSASSAWLLMLIVTVAAAVVARIIIALRQLRGRRNQNLTSAR